MITVTKNNRYLEKDGKYYPYLADTAWTLLQRLTRDEIVYYLDVRKNQGFNAIQVSAISELDGINVPNREGRLPFINGDVSRPDPQYFELLLFLLGECEKRDVVLTLLPTWGDKFNKKWGTGPEIFTPENAGAYGEYISGLVGCCENVIFMLGGDRPIESAVHRQIIDNMAAGIAKGEKVRHLMTYHPCGEATSLDYFPDCAYIDFHSIQSGHSFGGFLSEKMIKSVLKEENKPCLDAESFYEDFPIDFDLRLGYYFGPEDIRARIYGNMIAGSLGTVYGHRSVWCFKEKSDGEYPFDWKEALFRPMAREIGNINKFLTRVDVTGLREFGGCYNAVAAADEKTIVVFVTKGKPAFLKTTDKKIVGAKRFDVVKGEFGAADPVCSDGSVFIPPQDNETLLVIETKNVIQ